MRMRYFVYFSYQGTQYHGWQNQPNSVSVQEVMEKAFGTLLNRPTPLTAAGRTDAGVHASLMVAHFDSPEPIDTDRLAFRMNGYLPGDIAIERIVRVRDDAHARFDATQRTYHYYLTTCKSPFRQGLMSRTYYHLDVERMNEAARLLVGRQDFASFQKLHTDVKTTICDVREARWQRIAEDEMSGSRMDTKDEGAFGAKGMLVFRISADRFLRNMVRAIVGTLMDVGRGKLTVEQFGEIIAQRQRTSAAESAPAEGLYLTDVRYPDALFEVE